MAIQLMMMLVLFAPLIQVLYDIQSSGHVADRTTKNDMAYLAY